MKNLIMNEFEKTNSKPGHHIMMRTVRFVLAKNLNPKELDELNLAIESLIADGYITYENDGLEGLKLTEIGFNSLYQNSKSVEEIENLIMYQFEKQNSRTNDILLIRNLNFGLLRELNPKETELFNDSINSLINKKLVIYENSGMECLKLTELGYNSLY